MIWLVEARQRFADRRHGKLRKTRGKIGRRHAGLVGRHDIAEGGRCLACQKVADALRRRLVVRPARDERAFFPVALERDAGERIAWIVGRRDADHDPCVGVALRARILAHAVGHDAPRFGRRRHDRAARTHAEAIDRAPVAGVMHQLVVGRAQQRMPGRAFAPAAAIDQRLRMLDAHADGKRLRPLWPRLARASIANVSRAEWPDREHHMIGFDMRSVAQHHAAHASLSPSMLEIVDASSRSDTRRRAPRSVRAGSRRWSQARNVPMWGLAT